MKTTTNKAIERGDRIFLNFGCMSGEDTGTVIGKEETRGSLALPGHRRTKLWIRLSDFSVIYRVRPAAGQIGIVTEDDGVFEGAEKIGLYLVAN